MASVIRSVETAQIPRAQYGAVLIDEAHDFQPEWLKLVTGMADPETDSLLLLYDDAQFIFKKSKLGFTLVQRGHSGPWPHHHPQTELPQHSADS
ncbi:MAG: hypothetical protein ACOY7J_05340 [Pseudomonadota bacterium]